jgi:hypothetical protein
LVWKFQLHAGKQCFAIMLERWQVLGHCPHARNCTCITCTAVLSWCRSERPPCQTCSCASTDALLSWRSCARQPMQPWLAGETAHHCKPRCCCPYCMLVIVGPANELSTMQHACSLVEPPSVVFCAAPSPRRPRLTPLHAIPRVRQCVQLMSSAPCSMPGSCIPPAFCDLCI